MSNKTYVLIALIPLLSDKRLQKCGEKKKTYDREYTYSLSLGNSSEFIRRRSVALS